MRTTFADRTSLEPVPLPRCPMHATLPLLKATDFPPLARRALDTLQVNLGYTCNQACHHCHVNASPDRKEMMARETIDDVLRVLAARRIGTLDVTGGAPELNPHFRHLVREARVARRPRDRPLQPHDPERARLRGSRRVPRERARRDHRVAALLHEGQRRPAARRRTCSSRRSSRCASSTRWATGSTARASCSISSTTRSARACRPRRIGSRPTYKRELGDAFRHRVQPALHARQHADRALRLDAGHAGQVRELHGAPAFGAQPGQPRRRDVPDAGVGRLSRLPLRLRLQPDARHSARRRRASRGGTVPTC